MKRKMFWRIAIPIGIALWTLFIWSQSLKSAEVSSVGSGRVTAWLMSLLGWETKPVWLTHVVRKCAHFAEFGVLGVLWGVCGRLYPLRFVWLYGAVAGAVDECLQFFSPGRGPMVTDVLIDAAGHLCGWLLVLAVAHLCKRKGATA